MATLERQFGTLDLTALYVGVILGSGIFVAPSAVAKAVPSAWGGAALWLGAGVVSVCGALVYAECGARVPATGGFYVFYRDALGKPVAFLGGWAAFLITYPASIAAIAIIFARYFKELVGVGGPEWLWASGGILIAGTLNVVGMRTGPWTQRILTTFKVGALAFVCAAAIFVPGAESSPADTMTIAITRSEGLSIATVVGAATLLLWTYDGWSNVALVAGETHTPSVTLIRSVLIGTAILVGLYAATQIAVGAVLTPEQVIASKRVVGDAVAAAFGARAGRLVSALVVVSTFGSMAASLLSGSRIGFAMAGDRLLPRVFETVHPRWRTPAVAVIVLTVATVLYALTGTFGQLLNVFSFTVWTFYALTGVCLVIFRHRGTGGVAYGHGVIGWLVVIVLWLTAAGMTLGVVLDDLVSALIGVALLAAGFPLYWVVRRLAHVDAVSS